MSPAESHPSENSTSPQVVVRSSPPHRAPLRIPGWLLLSVGVAMAVALSYFAVLQRLSLGADRYQHAARESIEWVRLYVRDHEGAWPTSWEELASQPREQPATQQVPSELLQTYAEIDFSADPAVIATQSPASFTAIRPKSMDRYDDRGDDQIPQLLATLRRFHNATP